MSAFASVNGTYVGGWSWKKVTPLLRAAGHDVFAPTLTGLGERVHLATPDVDLDTHVTDVVNLLVYEDLCDVAGVAERAPERLAHLVFGDGAVPADAQPSVVDQQSSSAFRLVAH